MEEIWLDVNMLVNILNSNKMIVLGLDGAAPELKWITKDPEDLKAQEISKLEFFIKKKIEEDGYWKILSIIFKSSSSPG